MIGFPKLGLSKDVVDDLKQNFKKQLFTINGNEDDFIVIPRNVKLAESPSFGKPIILYDIKSSTTSLERLF